VKSRDQAGNLVTSGDFTFTTQTTAPSDTTAPVISAVLASAITTSSATISWTTNEPSDTQIEYGTTVAYGNFSALFPGLVGLHSQDLGFLSPSTVYQYRVLSRDAAGNLATSGNFTFTTPPLPDTNPPVITAVSTSAITTSGATIVWSTNEPADSQVEYGLSTAYGNSTALNAALVSFHSLNLSGLASSTVYHYRIKSKDLAGNAATSGDFTFVTPAPPPPILPPDVTPPVISAIAVTSITSSSADISWATDEPADRRVEYGLTTAYGNFVAVGTTLGTSHVQNLRFLSPATLYHFRVVSKDASRNVGTSGDFTFTTLGNAPPPPDVTPPVISGVAPSAINTSFAIIDWTTDEASDSQVEYGPTVAYGSSTSVNSSPLTSHSEVLGGLTVATVYHYRVKSMDAAATPRYCW
jgi:predicted MarR family transcription regulator